MNKWLLPISWLMWCVTELRNYMYDKRIIKSVRFDYPIISVGNLSTGGTGKTPHTEYLIRLLLYTHRVATLSRGYGRKTTGYKVLNQSSRSSEVGDEPLMFKRKYPEALITVGEDRLAAITEILHAAPDTDVILLDDAYQHRTIRPGLSILLTTFSQPFYADVLLPAGTLRESKKNYKRADILVVTKCPHTLTTEQKKSILLALQPLSYQKVYFTTVRYEKPYSIYDFNWKYDLEKNTTVLLVCGIADPQPLFSHLQEKSQQVYLRQFADHHPFDINDLDSIRETWNHLGDVKKVIITTEKDAVRLIEFRDWLLSNKMEVIVQPVVIDFLFNEAEQFNQDILNYIAWEKYQSIV